MSNPPTTGLRRRKYAHRRKQIARLDLSAAVKTPLLSGTLSTQLPALPAQAAATPIPITLSVGDPAVLQVDMRAAIEGIAEFIAEHPVLCTALAAGVIWAIWASNQPPRAGQSWA